MEKPAASDTPKWETDPVLTVEHLTMRFGGLVAVDDLSFDVGRGDITALIGPNGAGKTTVFNCVTGFYKPTEGRIVMRHGEGRMGDLVDRVTATGDQFHRDGDRAAFLLERMPDFQISERAKVARTFQNIRLFGGMTVLENLLVAQHNPLMVASGYTFGGVLGLPGYKRAEGEAKDFAAWWLEQVNLIDRADDPAADLPYGAQRRLEIARAMCTRPHLLCLDEPAAGLNPRESAQLNELLQFIRAERDTSVLLIEHDMGVVMEISDHIIVLDYGEKISDGDSEYVRNDAKVIAAYLGVDDEAEIDVPEVLKDIPHPRQEPKRAAAARKKAAASRTKTTAKPAAAKAARKSAAAAIKPARSAPKAATGPVKPKAARKPARPDDLKRISGVGPKIEGILNGLGIWQFAQIAGWKKAERDWVDDHLRFKGRIERDDWVKQAKTLARQASTAKTAAGAKTATRARRKK